MLKNLPGDVRTRTLGAVRNGTGKVEARTCVESSETKFVSYKPMGRKHCGLRELRSEISRQLDELPQMCSDKKIVATD